MKIKRLSIENIGKINHFTMSPDGKSVTIKGSNAQGKTTILNSIVLALSQLQGRSLFPQMVTNGKDTGSIEMTFDNGLTIKRTVRADNTTKSLKVTRSDGSKVTQADLDKMWNLISFKLNHNIDYETLKSESGLDLSDIEIEKIRAYEARTEAGREVKRTEAVLASMQVPEPSWPVAPVDVNDLIKQRDARDEVTRNNEVEKKRCEVYNQNNAIQMNNVNEDLAEIRDEILKLEARIKELKSARDMKENLKLRLDAEIKNPAKPEVKIWEGASDIDEQISNISENNKLYQKREAYNKAVAEVDNANKQWKEFNDKYALILKQEAERIASTDFGLEGLSIDPVNKIVLYHGLPFASRSHAEGLLIGLQWLANRNPEMKFALTQQVEDYLDDDNFHAFHKKADELGIQIINEQVRSIDPDAITIMEV